MKKFIKIFIIILLLTFAYSASASVLELNLDKSQIQEGGLSTLSVSLDTNGALVNTIEGDLVYNNRLIKIEKLDIGGSIVNLWIDKPKQEDTGRLHFSGIIPGGLSVSNGNIFSVVIRGQSIGSSNISLENINLFLNDGEGSRDSVKVNNVQIEIKENSTGSVELVERNDQFPPEEFNIVRSRDESLYDNQWFIAFSTQDKGVGVDHYRVCEFFGKVCTESGSPYLLKYQNPFYYINVTAYDTDGNSQDSTLVSRWIILIIILLSICILSLIFYLSNRYLKNYKV